MKKIFVQISNKLQTSGAARDTRMLMLTGVICSLVAVFATPAAMAADTGDAPASYGVALHNLPVEPPRFGWRNTDDDPIGIESDDLDNIDDEDGVPNFRTVVADMKSYTLNVWAANPTNEVANVVGWIDFNGDGRFSRDEAAITTVPPGTVDTTKIRLEWPSLGDTTTEFTGETYARFRITTDVITPDDFVGTFSDGEVEDYQLFIMPDADGDQIDDATDPDDDNDRIPDVVEGFELDTDGDGLLDYLDRDSDNDLLPDYFEVGRNPEAPVDTDGDGMPDYLDLDSNNDGEPDSQMLNEDLDMDGISGAVEGIGDADGDGILNALDIDSDNDGILDMIETLTDSDGDRIPNYLDLDSDNDGVPDLIEASHGVIEVLDLDRDGDGRLDPGLYHSENGLADTIETEPDSGVTAFVLADSDGDGIPDYLDLDSDSDGTPDLIEQTSGNDANADSQLDALVDTDGDGLIDSVDIDSNPAGSDLDGDGIVDDADIDFVEGTDSDLDGIVDSRDPDSDGNGFVDANSGQFVFGDTFPDSDADGIPDLQDAIDGPNSDETNGNGANQFAGIAGMGNRVQTGLSGNGGGCTITAGQAKNAAIDPLFILLLVVSFGYLALRRQTTVQAPSRTQK